MGKVTDIAWASSTWNPWMGCTKVSSGCKNCYMFRDMKRFGKNPDVVRRTSAANWRQPLLWQPGRVFTCSWSDFFIKAADDWRIEAWEVIRETSWHEWIILTKRPKSMWSRLPVAFPKGFEHVRLGVTVESQAYIDRIDDLLYIGRVPNMISVEPMLGPIDLTEYLRKDVLDWVIVGGESGPDCRKTELEWIYKIVADCKKFKVPVFVKQLGSSYPDSEDFESWPDAFRVRELPDFIGSKDKKPIKLKASK